MKESMTNLTNKQVINVRNGKIIGFVSDFIFDQCKGCLKAIILPGEGGFFGFKKCNDIIIPWENICKIGEDVILVDIDTLNHSKCECDNNK